MIEVTFLGIGAALPAPGQTNCCYLIEVGSARILFDCGPCVLQQLAAVNRTPGDITHLFISHGHGDHALGFPMFLLWWSIGHCQPGRTMPTVVASEATWVHLRALWEHSFNDIPAPAVIPVELPTTTPGSHALTPEIRLSTWPMIHSNVSPVLSARFEVDGHVLAFTADTARCDHVSSLAKGADLLVHDARHAMTVPPQRTSESQYHCTARDAGEYAAAAGVRNLALIHIGAEYEQRHAEMVAEAKTQFSGQVFAPRAGDIFRL